MKYEQSGAIAPAWLAGVYPELPWHWDFETVSFLSLGRELDVLVRPELSLCSSGDTGYINLDRWNCQGGSTFSWARQYLQHLCSFHLHVIVKLGLLTMNV